MPEKKTCAKCGRTGARQFKTDGDTFVCEATWACQGRRAETEAREAKPEETTCHKCGRIGWRGFSRDWDVKDRTAHVCSAWAACHDRQRLATALRSTEKGTTNEAL